MRADDLKINLGYHETWNDYHNCKIRGETNGEKYGYECDQGWDNCLFGFKIVHFGSLQVNI